MPPSQGDWPSPHLGRRGKRFLRAGGGCLISQDTVWLESSPLRSGNVKLSIQTRKPPSPEDSTLLEDSTSPSTKEQEAARGAGRKGYLGMKEKMIVRGRDEKRCEEGGRNVVQRRETVRDGDTRRHRQREGSREAAHVYTPPPPWASVPPYTSRSSQSTRLSFLLQGCEEISSYNVNKVEQLLGALA